MNTLDKLQSSKFVNSTAFQTALKVGKAGVAIGILSFSGMASADTFYNDYTKAGAQAIGQIFNQNKSLSPLSQRNEIHLESKYRIIQGCKIGDIRKESPKIINVQPIVVKNEAFQKNGLAHVVMVNTKTSAELIDMLSSNQSYLENKKCGPENISKISEKNGKSSLSLTNPNSNNKKKIKLKT